MKKIILLLFLLVLMTNISVAQQNQLVKPDGKTITFSDVDKIIKKLMDTAEVTGLGLGIITNNKVAYVKSYGYKNKSNNQIIDTATCIYAASFSKALFAYIVMQLVDEGVFDLDKPLYTYLPKPLPEYDKYNDLAGDERWKLITARHCLSHTTGFPNWRFFNPHDNKKLEIFFTPGQRYAYSGEGIDLLQLVVETVTAKPLEELAQQRIFKPFGMRRTSFLWQPDFAVNYAVGHDNNEDTLPKNKRTRADAAGSMETTIADYTRFFAAVMQGKELSKKAKDVMLSPQISINEQHQFPSLNTDTTTENKKIDLSYGLGWGLFTTPNGKAFFKEGHDDGWQNFSIGFPGKNFAVIVMTNSSNGESIFKELFEKVAATTIPWQWETYTPYRATVKLSQAILQQFTGEYDGKIKLTISLVNGQLKAVSETVQLSATNIYPDNDHHFFLKVMDAAIDFIKGADGKIERAVVNDEGEKYELTKVK